MKLHGYLLKEFNSQIVLNSKNIGASHFRFSSNDEENIGNNTTISYPDGVITAINPDNSNISLSFDNGVTWVNSVIREPVKNVKRVDKETFVFEIINGLNPTSFAVTYDMFMSYEIIPIGTDDDLVRMSCKNVVFNRPLSFIRNSLYIFDQKNKTYTKLEMFDSSYCSIHDSFDGISVCLFVPSSTGYTVKKYNKQDLYDSTYIDLYTHIDIDNSWTEDILSFNVIKSFDESDCFIITKSDFTLKIDVPSLGLFSDNQPDTYKAGFSYR